MVLNCNFLMVNDVDHFSHACLPSLSVFGEVFVQMLCLLFNCFPIFVKKYKYYIYMDHIYVYIWSICISIYLSFIFIFNLCKFYINYMIYINVNLYLPVYIYMPMCIYIYIWIFLRLLCALYIYIVPVLNHMFCKYYF